MPFISCDDNGEVGVVATQLKHTPEVCEAPDEGMCPTLYMRKLGSKKSDGHVYAITPLNRFQLAGTPKPGIQ